MRLACVQTNVVFNDPEANLRNALVHLEALAAGHVELVVFPEAYLTGYCVSTREAACAIALDPHSPVLDALQEAADRLGVHIVVGYAEALAEGISNTASLFAPNEPRRFYRKTHLPELGLDHFVTPGTELEVFDTALGKIGILICFDLRAPEGARVLALKGAELIVLPTNWPNGAQVSADLLAPARAVENRVFLASCDRTGDENGFHFIGLSKIIDPSGKILAHAGEGEAVLVADIDMESARVKRIVTIPGKHETTVFESRRPELYGTISE